jgi:hypothetical protein
MAVFMSDFIFSQELLWSTKQLSEQYGVLSASSKYKQMSPDFSCLQVTSIASDVFFIVGQ